MDSIINGIRLRLGETPVSDNLIVELTEDAIQAVIDYIHKDSLPMELEGVVKHMVITQINRMGDEGVQSFNRGGTSQSYMDGISKEDIRRLNSYRQLPGKR